MSYGNTHKAIRLLWWPDKSIYRFLQSLLCSDHNNCMTSHSLVQCHMYAHVDTGYTVTCIYIDQSHTIEITITCIVHMM